METGKELIRLRERLFKKPNPFDWSKHGATAQDRADHVNANPYDCDDCCDTYNKDDLIKHFRTNHLICRNCIDEYHKIYVEEKK